MKQLRDHHNLFTAFTPSEGSRRGQIGFDLFIERLQYTDDAIRRTRMIETSGLRNEKRIDL